MSGRRIDTERRGVLRTAFARRTLTNVGVCFHFALLCVVVARLRLVKLRWPAWDSMSNVKPSPLAFGPFARDLTCNHSQM